MLRNKAQNAKLKTQNLNSKNKAVAKVLSFMLLFCAMRYALYALPGEEFVYDAQGKRDPFIALVTADGMLLNLDKVEGPLTVEGIIYDKHGLSYAIVNGEVKRVGDSISDYKVLRIERDKVIFIKDGQTIEIKLKEEGS